MTANAAPVKRATKKRDIIIDEATHVLNSQGLGNTRLMDVAEKVGLTRAALYYYFRDMEALAVACYERTIGDIRESALKAQAIDGSGRAKLECYFQTMLSPDVLDRIVLVEASALNGPRTEGLVASLDEAVNELIK